MASMTRKPLVLSWMQHSDVLLAIGVVIVIAMMVIPITTWMLDTFIAVNLVVSLITLLVVMYTKRTAEFNVFPTLLLLTTVFRLAINISSTRLIMLEGPNFDGQFIRAFGDFVVAGNYVVGIIIFLILIAVQFIVITKGATRVAEVAARFTLDALPGKQLSIDADLNAGLIDEREAIKRRKETRQEADFYGAMDGASKFVQGDVRVGLLIVLINVIGGLVVGTMFFNMSLGDAFKLFILLTVGDGLVAQLPALMLSVATGIIVTRAVSEDSLGKDLSEQLTSSPKALYIGGGFLLLIAFLPGFPAIPLLLMSILFFGLGWLLTSHRFKHQESEEDSISAKEEISRGPENVVDLVNVEPLELEIGFNLVPFVDIEQGGDLLERVKLIRKSCALDLGLVVPPIRIRDNMKLKPSDYLIKVKGVEVGKGSLKIKKLLAIPSFGMTEEIEGEETIEPAFRTKAKWISEEQRDRAESLGYSVVDPPSIIATHLTEVIKRHSSELLGRQEVRQLIDSIKQNYPAVIEECLKAVGGGLGDIQKILQSLLRERVSIRNLVSILETIADYGGKIQNLDVLTEYVRQRLAQQISHQYMDDKECIHVFTLSPNVEAILEESLQETDRGFVSTLETKYINQIIQSIGSEINRVKDYGMHLIILCSSNVRSLVKNITERTYPNLVVLSYNEIISSSRVVQLGIISIQEEESLKEEE